jgi:hypothetical protein
MDRLGDENSIIAMAFTEGPIRYQVRQTSACDCDDADCFTGFSVELAEGCGTLELLITDTLEEAVIAMKRLAGQ